MLFLRHQLKLCLFFTEGFQFPPPFHVFLFSLDNDSVNVGHISSIMVHRFVHQHINGSSFYSFVPALDMRSVQCA